MADKYLRDFKAPLGLDLPTRVLSGILALAEFLVSEARIMESGSEPARKEAKEQIPVDRIKDAPAAARELRWRVKQTLGYHSDDEGVSKPKNTILAGTKRRRVDDQEDAPHFRNFKPKPWDSVTTTTAEESQHVLKAPKPKEDDDDWTRSYVIDGDLEMDDVEGEEAQVNSRREVVIKVRRTAKGLERQRIERTVEDWRWE